MEQLPQLLQSITGNQASTVEIGRFLSGNASYKYAFTAARTGDSFTSYIYNCTVTISQIASKRSVINRFKLMVHSKTQGVIVCQRLGHVQIHPAITLPVEYQPRSQEYLIEGGFKDMRALFSLNSFEDGFGWLSTFFCSKIRLHLLTKPVHGLKITCIGLGGYVLNQAEPTFYEEEDDQTDEFEQSELDSVAAE